MVRGVTDEVLTDLQRRSSEASHDLPFSQELPEP